jgi:transposase InsO family protein
MIDTEKKAYPIALLCKVMQVSRTGYYSWRTRGKSARRQEYETLIPVVQEAHRIAKGTYGSRRISQEVELHGTACGRRKARKLMKLADVPAKQKRKCKVTADSKHKLPVAPNLLNREFNVAASDRVYVSDITYIRTKEGWLYLTVFGLFSPTGCRAGHSA